jgi:hypothetical protein
MEDVVPDLCSLRLNWMFLALKWIYLRILLPINPTRNGLSIVMDQFWPIDVLGSNLSQMNSLSSLRAGI